VPLIKKLSHFPIIVDPSHGTGVWDLVAPMARAGVAAGADGMIVEIHPDPLHAWSDLINGTALRSNVFRVAVS
jgi:3-deoxy-7-phosphoheptulonate synthase